MAYSGAAGAVAQASVIVEMKALNTDGSGQSRLARPTRQIRRQDHPASGPGTRGAVTDGNQWRVYERCGDNSEQFAEAVRQSIMAVESVARKIEPDTLGPALNTLKKEGIIKHPALNEAFSKLYGYTSDEEGIRHSLVNRDSADLAQFMFGACASFGAYLINQRRKVCERQGTGR